MKIAVIGAKGIPPKQGGIEHYCAEMYPRMVAQGHTVDLFARTSATTMAPFASYDYRGVRVVSLPGSGIKGVDAFVTSAIGSTISSWSKYDVIHFHALGPALFTGQNRGDLSGTRLAAGEMGPNVQPDSAAGRTGGGALCR
jgi:glycosyltransferase involved in cell wall biosynthesis